MFRLDPGDPATTKLYATRFGAPPAAQRIDLTADNSAMEGQQKQGFGLGPEVGVPADALSFPDLGRDRRRRHRGRDAFRQRPGQPARLHRRAGLRRRFDWHGADLAAYVEDTVNTLSVLLWSGYTPAPEPTWMDDIRPILRQYADLYPVMRSVLDLDDYHSVVENKLSLQVRVRPRRSRTRTTCRSCATSRRPSAARCSAGSDRTTRVTCARTRSRTCSARSSRRSNSSTRRSRRICSRSSRSRTAATVRSPRSSAASCSRRCSTWRWPATC